MGPHSMYPGFPAEKADFQTLSEKKKKLNLHIITEKKIYRNIDS